MIIIAVTGAVVRAVVISFMPAVHLSPYIIPEGAMAATAPL